MLRIQLDTLLREALASLPIPEGLEEIVAHGCQLERAKNSKHGDFSTNIALRLAKSLNQEPRAFAEKIVESLKPSPLVEKAEIAGPGFINFILTTTAYHEEITSILKAGKRYGSSNTGANCRVLVEYISANPTGPLHVGHGRHAAYGASISNLLRATGHDVHEEYYVNDAGRQMDILTISVWFRYAELRGQFIPFPENAYQGNYVKEIAGILNHSRGENLLPDSNDLKKIIEHPN
ncbi:MAG: arginine--tRNA ligase, partial [Pseudomonadota bacterium]|nr:arginine--tRNA ligase [Pseudomonadota bacterium]